MIDAIRSSETLVTTYKTTRRNTQKEHKPQFHRRKNLIPQTNFTAILSRNALLLFICILN
jgi:hypothetical protein